MGTDWMNYHDNFMKALENQQSGMELGFQFYTNLIRTLTDSYTIYLLITSIFIYVGIFYTIFKYTKYSFLSIFYLTMCLTWYSGSLRQMLAIVFFTISIKFLIDRKLFKFLLFVFIGATFHTTILAFLPIYWLYGITFITYIFIFLSLFIISSLSGTILIQLDTIIQYFNPGKTIENRVGGGLEGSNPLLGFSRKILTTFGYYYFYNKTYIKTRGSKFYTDLSFLFYVCCLSILFYFLGTYYLEHLSSRLDIYSGIICASIFIGKIEYFLQTYSLKILNILFYLFILFLCIIYYSRLEYMDLFHPYSSIFYNYNLRRFLY
jgi:hypothetical protein